MDFSIDYLTGHLQDIPTIAKWHIQQWHNFIPDYTPESYARFLSTHYKSGGIPTMFVAVHEGKVIGTAALDDDDMETHPELTPWLASLYTDVKYRHNGVGEALVERVIAEARGHDVKKLYLYTPDRQHYHERFGFRTVFQENYYGDLVSVMRLDLTRTPNPSKLWWMEE